MHCIFILLFIFLSITSDVNAAKIRPKTVKSNQGITVSPLSKPTSLIADMSSGLILHANNEQELIYPASLAKLMTAYIVFEMLESGQLHINNEMLVSKRAENEKPSKLGLTAGERIKVRDAVNALVIRSANDVSIVFAEKISGSEEKFVKLMTQRARILGMKNTVFRRASGWHHPKQYSTAVDLAKLAIALKRDFPKYYPLFSKSSFVFKKRIVSGHNPVTEQYKGANGLKTGFTNPSGFNLITTATRGNRSLVGVVTGSKTADSRNKKMIKLLDKYFNLDSHTLERKQKQVSVLPNKLLQ